LLCLAILAAGAGCYKTAAKDPFARQEPDVQLEGLAAIGAGAMGQFGLAFQETMIKLSGRTPPSLRFARSLNDPDANPDDVHEALLGLVEYDYGRSSPYTDAYMQFGKSSPYALVRATAIRALNISRHDPATPLFIEALADANVTVRLEAVKALANLPDRAAVPRLIELATNAQENIDVRIAAVDALRHYEAVESRRVLVRLLESDDFAVVWQARRSLVTATGEDHGFDVNAWRAAIG
jgi:HEAT repeat protein